MATESQSGNIPAYRKYYILYLLAALIGVVSFALIYGVFKYLYDQTTKIMVEQTKSSLLTLSKTQSLRISYEDVLKVSSTTDIGSESHVRLVNMLHDIRDVAPDVAFAYILKYAPTKEYQYIEIADADSIDPYANTDDRTDNDVDVNKDGIIEPNGADELTYPGVPYMDAPVDDLIQAHDKPHVNETFYTDKWGTFISAYTPIKDNEGNLVGILALDLRYNDVLSMEQEVYRPFLGTVIVLTISLVMLGFTLIYVWQKKLKQVLDFDKQKNIVIGMIGHELKTPLASIRWILSSVLEIKDISPEVTKKVTQAYNVSVSAAEMSNTILDLSRIQLGKLDLVKEKCDFLDLVHSIESEMLPIAESKEITLNFEGVKGTAEKANTCIDASPQYMKIAIKNLISNAIKYTPKGGIVHVSVTIPITGKVYFTVSDTGAGIARSDQKDMFQKFSRAKATSSIEGHGLGLYLTNNIVLLHGGSLHFTSIVGKGTEFVMEIPQYQV